MRRILLLTVLALVATATTALAGDEFLDAFDVPDDATFTGSESCAAARRAAVPWRSSARSLDLKAFLVFSRTLIAS